MKRILIVEDDMALAQELQYLLISNQYDAQCVEEFTDVAGQILASQADMVLLDINLPEVDGQSVLRELRKTSDIPAIMVTSKNTEMDIDTTVEAVDLISAFLDEKGVEGVMIEDHVPLTEEDKAAMFDRLYARLCRYK